MQRQRGHLEPALERPLVQRLDVREHVLELEAARVDPSRGEAPEHERVVGIRAMPEADQHGREATTGLAIVPEEPALELLQDLLALERRHVSGRPSWAERASRRESAPFAASSASSSS